MIILGLIGTATAIALLFYLAIVWFLRHINELDKKWCENCEMYDRTLHTCWLRFEERFPADKACDRFQKRDKEEVDKA